MGLVSSVFSKLMHGMIEVTKSPSNSLSHYPSTDKVLVNGVQSPIGGVHFMLAQTSQTPGKAQRPLAVQRPLAALRLQKSSRLRPVASMWHFRITAYCAQSLTISRKLVLSSESKGYRSSALSPPIQMTSSREDRNTKMDHRCSHLFRGFSLLHACVDVCKALSQDVYAPRCI